MLDSIARLRRFNRIVTREIGALDASYLGRGRPLGTARVLHLIGPAGIDVAEIRDHFGLDTGLLSRLLRGLEAEGLVITTADPADRRRRIATLTPAGTAEWNVYDQLGHAKAEQVFAKAGARQQAVIDAMDLIATVLNRDLTEIKDGDADDPAALHLIGSYYKFLTDTIPNLEPAMFSLPISDAAKYRAPEGAFLLAWSEDLPIGCVSLRKIDADVAEVKRLWVDPLARGQRLGLRLMRAIEERARKLGYHRLLLDSNTGLTDAIAMYRANGWTEIDPYSGPPSNIWMTKVL